MQIVENRQEKRIELLIDYEHVHRSSKYYKSPSRKLQRKKRDSPLEVFTLSVNDKCLIFDAKE